MFKDKLWTALLRHPATGWMTPGDPALPELRAGARLLWCGTGGTLLPAAALVRACGDERAQEDWLPLASSEAQPVALRPSDQLVFASRSGKTLELWTWIGRLRSLPGWAALEQPPLVITQDDGNPLAAWARAEGWRLLAMPPEVGGRYAAFSPVGTLPLAWLGRDAQAFLQGGRDVAQEAPQALGHWGSRIWGMVETLHEGYLAGIQEWVLLPYGRRLEPLTAWWAQLLAESLGKMARDGTRRGLTAIPAVGPMAQHAQLQRWMAGPRNLGVILLTVAEADAPPEHLAVPQGCPYPALAGLQGGQILQAQAEGTLEALEAAGVPVVHWHLEPLSERTLGEFMMAWQLIVALTGFALEVDPFSQPELADGQRRTLAKLGLP